MWTYNLYDTNLIHLLLWNTFWCLRCARKSHSYVGVLRINRTMKSSRYHNDLLQQTLGFFLVRITTTMARINRPLTHWSISWLSEQLRLQAAFQEQSKHRWVVVFMLLFSTVCFQFKQCLSSGWVPCPVWFSGGVLCVYGEAYKQHMIILYRLDCCVSKCTFPLPWSLGVSPLH